MNFTETTLTQFDDISDACLTDLRQGEELTLSLAAEDQHYLRFNNARVRQSTQVEQRRVTLRFQVRERRVDYRFDLAGTEQHDTATALSLLDRARQECAALPADPFTTPLLNHGGSEQHHPGRLPEFPELMEQIMASARGVDFTGLYAGGPQLRATRNSAGLRQAFSTSSFFLDYSLFTVNPAGENKAVKGLVAGREWESRRCLERIAASRQQLGLLKRESHPLAPGRYRVYFAPAAVEAMLAMFSWGGVSYSAWKKGESALKQLIEGQVRLSPLFNLREDFRPGLTPAFNSQGETAPECLPIIQDGVLENLLINARTAHEHGVPANGAEADEGLRSPVMEAGTLPEAGVLAALGSGIYISNLHYLNWSDLQSARLTGMTRYACFWVENGAIVAPIRDLRFDESLYRIFGSELEAVAAQAEVIMNTNTYGQRSLGGGQAPGILVRDFRFTL
jgi:predicted Zn-dependent protease